MNKLTKKSILVLSFIFVSNLINAQFTRVTPPNYSGFACMSAPTINFSNINASVGQNFNQAVFHINKPIQQLAQMECITNFQSSYSQLLYLTKEIGTSFPRITITSKPSWGLDIKNEKNDLVFSYVDFNNQPQTFISPPPFSLQKTVWPKPADIFSIGQNQVMSNVELKLNNNLTFNQTSTLNSNGRFHITGTELLYLLNKKGVIVSKAWGGNGDLTVEGNATINGEFKVKDQNGDYQFAIDNGGFVRAREVKVDYDYIPDYVFKKEYKLMSLEELGKFIEKEQHLPNIKAENEFDKKEGLSLGEMNLKLLEKVEELTLYILQLKKQNDDLQTQINNLKKN